MKLPESRLINARWEESPLILLSNSLSFVVYCSHMTIPWSFASHFNAGSPSQHSHCLQFQIIERFTPKLVLISYPLCENNGLVIGSTIRDGYHSATDFATSFQYVHRRLSYSPLYGCPILCIVFLVLYTLYNWMLWSKDIIICEEILVLFKALYLTLCQLCTTSHSLQKP